MLRMRINIQLLIYFCVLSLLGSRLIVYLGFPSIVNFVHFGFLLLIILLNVLSGKVKRNKYTVYLIILACIIIFSALINFVAPLNTILTLLILLEPFILVCSFNKWSDIFYIKMENMLVVFSMISLFLSYFQFFVLKFKDDDVRGIFLQMGSGGHLNGAFSIIMAIYFLFIAFNYKSSNKRFFSIVLSIMFLAIVVMCDNKQSILGYGLGLVLLLLSNVKNYKRFAKNLFIMVIGLIVFYFLTNSVLSKVLTWLNNIEYVFEGIQLKFSFIKVLRENRSNIFQLFFGFGPGMSLSRVARLLPEYKSLSFLGISFSLITQQFKDFYATSWLMQASSLWMFYFSFASFFGDLGIFGLVTMIMLYIKSIKKFCNNQLSRYLLFVVCSHGLLFDWLEEPSFMVVYFLIIVLIGHKWEGEKGRLIFKI